MWQDGERGAREEKLFGDAVRYSLALFLWFLCFCFFFFREAQVLAFLVSPG